MESAKDELAYDVYDGEDDDVMTEPLCPVVILHGIFDHKGNWADIAKEIAEKTVRKVYVLDMRDHGDSPKTSTMTHDNNVRDLENFLRKLKKASVLIGHSLGGTAAIDLAFHQPNLVKELILIDISPLKYPENEEDYGLNICKEMKRALLKLPTDINQDKAKSIIKDEINKSNTSPSMNKIICSNLDKCGESWRWKVNLEPIEKMAKLKAMRNVYPLRGTFEGICLLIHSNSSGYVVPGFDYKVLKMTFPKIKIACFKNCSHWIHVDMSRELVYSIVQHLNKNEVTA